MLDFALLCCTLLYCTVWTIMTILWNTGSHGHFLIISPCTVQSTLGHMTCLCKLYWSTNQYFLKLQFAVRNSYITCYWHRVSHIFSNPVQSTMNQISLHRAAILNVSEPAVILHFKIWAGKCGKAFSQLPLLTNDHSHSKGVKGETQSRCLVRKRWNLSKN